MLLCIKKQINIDLKVQIWDSFHVYLHNRNQVIAKKVDDIFGQKDIPMNVGDQLKNSLQFRHFRKDFKIKRTHWKALDRPEKKCSEGTTEANITKCIAHFIEQTIGCSIGVLGSNPQIQV